jgi:DNA-binding NarL/FixJ family response regulator
MSKELRVRVDPPGVIAEGLGAVLRGVPGIQWVSTGADVRISCGWPIGPIRLAAANAAPERVLVLVRGLDSEAASAAVSGVAAFCHWHAEAGQLLAGLRRAAQGRPFYGSRLRAELHRAAELARRAGCDRPEEAVEDLTRAEWPVALLTACGLDSASIAAMLQLGIETVRTHRAQAYSKLGVHGRQELRDRYWAALWPRAPRART